MKARAWRLQGCRGAIRAVRVVTGGVTDGAAGGVTSRLVRATGMLPAAGLLWLGVWTGRACAATEQQFGSGPIVASGVAGGGLNTAASRVAEAASQPAVIGSAVPSLGFAALFQAIFGLLLVVGLILGCAWIARRFGVNRPAPRLGLVKYVSSTALSQKERVVVVEIEGTWLVLGVAPGSVNHLHTLPAREAAPAASAGGVAPNVSQFAMDFRQRLGEKLGKSPRRDDSESAS
jgi:flagellar protein FliO/FliZ